MSAHPSTIAAAAREIEAAIAAEFAAEAPDARRIIRDERMTLQARLQLCGVPPTPGTRADVLGTMVRDRDVLRQVAECRRVREMWTVRP